MVESSTAEKLINRRKSILERLLMDEENNNSNIENDNRDLLQDMLSEDDKYEVSDTDTTEQHDDSNNQDSGQDPEGDNEEKQSPSEQEDNAAEGDTDNGQQAEGAETDTNTEVKNPLQFDVAQARKAQLNAEIRQLNQQRNDLRQEVDSILQTEIKKHFGDGRVKNERGEDMSVEELISGEWASPYTEPGEEKRPFTIAEAQYYLSQQGKTAKDALEQSKAYADHITDNYQRYTGDLEQVMAEYSDVIAADPELVDNLDAMYKNTIRLDRLGLIAELPVDTYKFYSQQLSLARKQMSADAKAKEVSIAELEAAQKKAKADMKDRTDLPRKTVSQKPKGNVDELALELEKDETY